MLAGLGVQLVGHYAKPHLPALVAQLVGFLAGGIIVYGGTRIARAKGYTPWVGFIALVTYLGVGFLLMFPEAPERKAMFRLLAHRGAPDAEA